MQDEARYGVGIDFGTDRVRVAIGLAKAHEKPTVVGYGEKKNYGMRKGTVVDLERTAEAVDQALATAEKMSGYHASHAIVSINGSHISGLTSKGVVAVTGKEVGENDVLRAQDAARVVQLGDNREILDITPRSYSLSDQDGIKDPIGMTGVRLEVDTFIITALEPHMRSIGKVMEMIEMSQYHTIFSGIAAAQLTLSDQQRENGVVCINFGATTTDITVYEEGELLHAAVLPVGSNNITNDLAIGLKTDLDIAEQVKLQYAVATPEVRRVGGRIRIKSGEEMYLFDTEIVDEIVAARVEEIFELVNLELKNIGRYAKLPGGAVITGGGAQLTGITVAAKQVMQLSAHIGKAPKFNGMGDKLLAPTWTTALGLMMIDLDAALMFYEKEKNRGNWAGLFRRKK